MCFFNNRVYISISQQLKNNKIIDQTYFLQLLMREYFAHQLHQVMEIDREINIDTNDCSFQSSRQIDTYMIQSSLSSSRLVVTWINAEYSCTLIPREQTSMSVRFE